MPSDDLSAWLRFRYLDDYGESHYIGPIEGAQPMSEAWVNGFDHQGISSLIPAMSIVRSRRTLYEKAGSTSNSITYPHSKAAFTLAFFVTGSSYGPAYTPLT